MKLLRYLYKSFAPTEAEKAYNVQRKYGLFNCVVNKDYSFDFNVDQLNTEIIHAIYNGEIKVNNINGNLNLYKYFNSHSTLVNSPKYISHGFKCGNIGLKSLKGCPEYIGGNLECMYNNIKSFDYFPKSLGGHFNCNGNPIDLICRLFKDKNKIELFNDYDIIRDDHTIVLKRLDDFLIEIGKKNSGDPIPVELLIKLGEYYSLVF